MRTPDALACSFRNKPLIQIDTIDIADVTRMVVRAAEKEPSIRKAEDISLPSASRTVFAMRTI